MKIESIAVQNFLGVPDFRHALQHPVLLIAGKNGAGKSSLQDAIRFALTGELARSVKLQKDRSNLITDGAAAGFAEVTVDGYQIRRNIGSGSTTKDEFAPNRFLPLCLDTGRFAALPESERRSALFELSDVKVNRDTVAEQLADVDGVGRDMIERILPLLRNGFPEAERFAKERASEARGAWKAITNEVYGSNKAEGWTAVAPDDTVDTAEVQNTREAVKRSEELLRSLAEAKGRAEQAVSPERVAELRALADMLPDLQARYADAEARVRAARAALDDAQAAQRATPRRCLTCPECQTTLALEQGALVRAAAEPPAASPPDLVELAGLADTLTEADNALAALRRDVRQAEAAGLSLDALPPALDPEDLKACARLDEESRTYALHKEALRTLEAKLAEQDAAAGKTARAAAEHAAVVGWTAVAKAMSSEGIPAVLLSRALDPINQALAAQAAAAGWSIPAIERDLSLTYGGRQLGLCSESEQWRANLLFTLIVATASGNRLLALDRFDVLDPPARGDAIDYLDSLTRDGILQTAIVTGTFKAPLQLEGIDTVWLENGGAVQPRAEAA